MMVARHLSESRCLGRLQPKKGYYFPGVFVAHIFQKTLQQLPHENRICLSICRDISSCVCCDRLS